MANDNRSSRKGKDGETIKSNKKKVTNNASPASVSGSTDTSGLRRSAREASSKKPTTSSSPSTRKSERLEKQTPDTLPIKKNSERNEKQIITTPLRRSGRAKKHTSSGSSGSKRSNEEPASSDTKSKREVGSSSKNTRQEKQDPDSGGRKRKRMTAHVYKALFKPQKIRQERGDDKGPKRESKSSQATISSNGDVDKELKSSDTLHQINNSESGFSGSKPVLEDKDDVADECSDRAREECYMKAVKRQRGISNFDAEEVDNEVQVEESDSKRRTNHEFEQQQILGSCDTTCNKDLCGTSCPKDRGTCEAAGLTADDVDGDGSICFACKSGGKLMRCDAAGCNKYYHLSCLDPPVDNVTLGNWLCPFCVKNIKRSIPAVSHVAESIWDTREVMVSDGQGLQRQTEYWVKYKGLAHTHNQWVTETKLLLEAPLLVSNFSKNHSTKKSTAACTVPHQLLKKRLFLTFKTLNESQDNEGEVSNYHYEWLVKWKGLDYEQATWEMENSSVLNSPEGRNLMKEYEDRQGKKEVHAKFPTIPAGCLSGMDNIHLSYVKNLHDCWNKRQNNILFDDQERAMRVVLFVLLMKDVSEPVLIITTNSSLPQWEAMFSRMAPCNNFHISIKEIEGQRSVRLLEVQNEGDQLVFQVLIYHVDAFFKDLSVLQKIKWEAVLVDECQRSEISTHFDHIKSLSTDHRLLLFCSPLRESMDEYLNVLSLLGCDQALPNQSRSKAGSDDRLGKLKENLSRFIAYDCKSDSSKFIEFWVPVQISNLQLEQYCSSLLLKSMALRSCAKTDTFGALREILISNRKCCDHPYIVDPSLQISLTKDLQPINMLDFGIKASGKLQFLDLVLPEMKKRQLRVLILFQPISGSGRDSTSIGDILDDFVRQRFGADSYERVDGGIVPSKKQAALNNFNNKDMNRFIFLLEYRACLSSIRLSSVDTIVIFDSDWNPANDLRALQKITIDSQSEQIMIFRLYTKCTLEEKILRLSEHNVTIDSKLQNISRSTSDALLMWGASYLFDKLTKFHSASVADISSEESFLNKLTEEFLNLISHNCNSKDTANPNITRVQQNCETYGKNLPLPSELITELPDGEKPHMFWRKLLDGRNPQWKYLSVSTPRQRKRPQYFDASSRLTNAGSDDVGKKRKKTMNNSVEPVASKPMVEGGTGGAYEGDSEVPAHDGMQLSPGDSFWSTAVHNETSLHDLLKLNVSKLCTVLSLSEDIKIMVERFLKYVIDNYRVNKEHTNTLQAFLISLCWIGSSLSNHELDKRESLALAKKHLNFRCKEEEANSVHSKLEQAKEKFIHQPENPMRHDASKYSVPAPKANSTISLDPKVSHSVPLNLQGVKVVAESRHNQHTGYEKSLLEPGKSEKHKLSNEKSLQCMEQRPSTCNTRMEEFVEKTKQEIEKLNREWAEKREQLEHENKVDKAFIRTLHSNPSVRSEKLKLLDIKFVKNLEEHKQQHRDIQLKLIGAVQLAEEQMATHSICSSSEGKSHNELPLHGSQHENQLVCSGASEHGAQDHPNKTSTLSRNLIDVQSLEKDIHVTCPSVVVPADIVTKLNMAASDNICTETLLSSKDPNSSSDKVNAMSSKLTNSRIEDKCNRGDSSSTNTKNAEVDVMVFEELPATGNGELPHRIGSPSNGANNIETTSSHTSNKQMTDATVADATVLIVLTEDIPAQKLEGVSNDVGGHVESVEVGVPALDYNEITEKANVVPDASHAGEDQNGRDPTDVDGHFDLVEVGVQTVTSNKDNAEGGNIVPDASHPVEDQNDSHSSSSSNSPSTAVSQEKVPSVQPSVSPASHHSVPSNLDIQNESIHIQQLQCSDIRDKEVQASPTSLADAEVDVLQLTEAGQVDRVNSESSSLEPCEEENQSDILPANGLALETTCEAQTIGCDSRTPSQRAKNCNNPSENNAMLQSRTNMEEHPLVAAGTPLAEPQPDLNSADRVDQQPCGELLNSSQNPEAPPQDLETIAEIQNQAASRTGLDPSNLQGSDQVVSRMPIPPTFSPDPLQAELERLSEVKENVIKSHEDLRLRLKSDCEKEITEMIAQINAKYEAKRQDAEAAFHSKKKELDINFNRVLMNKILAGAFRSKCQDLSPSGSSGLQQATQSGLMQHLSVQPSLRRSPGVASSLRGQSSAAPPLQIVRETAALFSSTPTRPPSYTNPINSSGTPTRPSSNPNPINSSSAPTRPLPNPKPINPSTTPNRPQSNANPPNRPPSNANPPNRPPSNSNPISSSGTPSRPPPSINLSSPPSRPPPNINPITPSSTPSRPPPNINPITPSSTTLRASGEIRAPAPHIRPFRPSVSLQPNDFSSLQRMMPTPRLPTSLPPTSPNLYQASNRPPHAPSSVQPTQPLPRNQPPSRSQSPQPPSEAPSRPPALSQFLQPLPPRASSQAPSQPPSEAPSQLPSLSQFLQPLPRQASSESAALPLSSEQQRPPSSLPLPRIPPVSTSLYGEQPRPENGGVTPDYLSPLAADLLRDVDDGIGVDRPQPELSFNFELLDLSELGREGGAAHVNNSSGAHDLVCLSDDD